MVCKDLHVTVYVSSPFLLTDKSNSVEWIDHIWFIQLPADEHLGCFHLLAAMNNVTVNIRVKFLCRHVSFLLITYQEAELLGRMKSLYLKF